MAAIQDNSDAYSADSNWSILSRSVDRGILLPNLSPLSDRAAFRATPVAEQIGRELYTEGFDVGWNQGRYEVSQTPPARQSVMDQYIIPPTRGAFRPRTPSFVSWSTLKSKQGFDDDAAPRFRPSTAPEFTTTYKQSYVPLRPSTSWRSSGAKPFQRFARPPPPINVPTDANGEPPSVSGRIPSSPSNFVKQPAFHPGSPAGIALQPDDTRAPDASVKPSFNGPRGRFPMPMSVAAPDCEPSRSIQKEPAGRPGTSSGDPKSKQRGPQQDSLTFKSILNNKEKGQGSHPMASWRPTRGHALIVFNEMDKDKNGKITKSEFEEAAVSLGFSGSQAEKMFNKLDANKRGFLICLDWGKKEFAKVVEAFTLMFMQKHMGLPDITATDEQVRRYFYILHTRQVKSLPAAINLVRVNAVTRGAHASAGSGNAIYDAFRFIDTDNSGELSKDELKDAFFAMGVYLTDDVAEQIMTVFDKDGDGSVNYYEFARAMFGKVVK